MRFVPLMAALLAAHALCAQFHSHHAPGYTRTERGLPTAAPGSFLSHGGAAWDPTGPDLYYWDVAAGVVRRFDTAGGAPAATELFTVPPGPFGFTYVDTMAFDEGSNALYVGESGAQVIHKVLKTGPDAIDTTFGSAGILTSAVYSFFLYDLKFDSSGRLLGSGANLFGNPESGVYLFNKNTLAATQVVDLLTPGGSDVSGPIAFDAQGNLYFAAPPAQPGDPMRVLRWSKQQLDGAIASGGASMLTVAEAAAVVDWIDNFPAAGSMGFRFEGGKPILYFAGDNGSLYRSDLATRAYSIFATAAVPPTGEVAYPSALALESPAAPFRPFSGDSARLCIVMGARDMGFDQVRHAICIFGCDGSPAGVADLEVSGLPFGVGNGVPFGAGVELRDSAGMLAIVNGTVEVAIVSGAGTLAGRTSSLALGGIAFFDELVLQGGSGSVTLRFSVAGGTAFKDTAALPVASTGGIIDTSREEDNGCSAGGTGSWAMLAVMAALLTRRRARRER